ncbi:phosphomethylpyrimidine kinase, putative [Plasmodium gaboni]|uniref:Phosphomethylpyrimidine kinase, putative n=1 Tax=Plasmodium gaboni TaxID=647221 RepID=A0ABY1UJN2_9APIC|nr:phosphomethylpyrimidine kinase, putative [Plasmodium gaboni]
MEEHPKILSIAGSDSCAGAGMQADLKTAMSLGCHCCTILVVLTAQNTKEVKSIIEVDEKFIVEQLDAIFTDITIEVVKLGVLYSKKIILLIHNYITNINKMREKKLLVVFDPVFVSSSGCMLVESLDYVKYALDLICPISCIITPNFYECKVILEALNINIDINNMRTSELCKLVTKKLNISACLFKSCNIDINTEDENKLYAVDHLCIKNDQDYNTKIKQKNISYDVYKLKSKRNPQKDIHGTGCTLSTAISCFLSKKYDIIQACIESKKYIYNCINFSYDLGSKSQGLNHLKAAQHLTHFSELQVIKIDQNL